MNPKREFLNGLQKSGWKYWDHFQVIHPGASAKGRNAFSAACAVLDQTLDSGLPSDDDEAAVITSLGPFSSSWSLTLLILATRGIFLSPQSMEMNLCHYHQIL